MDAMLECLAMKREAKENVQQQNTKRQWIVDASSVVNFEVVVWADSKDEAIAKAKVSLSKNDSNVYEDYGEIKIDDVIEIQSNVDKVT